MKNHWIKRGIGICFAVVAGVILLGFVIMHLWNWLIPVIFTGAATINYCQALGIFVLSKILFGGFKGRHGCGCSCGGSRGGWWRNHLKAKWSGMSEEEREKFRKCCGSDCGPESEIK